MVNLTFYNKPPPSNKPPGGLIEIQEKDENETVLNKPPGGVNENNSLLWSTIEIHIFNVKNSTENGK